MKAIWLYGPSDARLVDTEKPQIDSDSVMVKVESCVLCGSDVHIWDGRHPPVAGAPYPWTFGHETAGTVVEAGENVTGLAIGDRISWWLTHGTLREYCVFKPSEMAIGKLAPHVTWEEGANIQLLAAVIRGVANSEPAPGQRALVLGCGAVGLSVMQLALAMGVDEVVATELIPFRREMALKLGASATVDPGQPGWDSDLGPFDIVYDCMDEDHAPGRNTLNTALGTLEIQATCVIIGISSHAKPIDTSQIVLKGLTIIGAHNHNIAESRRLMAMCCQWVADGTVKVSDYVTHRFPIEETQKAVEAAASQADGLLKVAITLD